MGPALIRLLSWELEQGGERCQKVDLLVKEGFGW